MTVRSMSLQRMFEPGAAAVAGGLATAEGDNSVVFAPPVRTAAAAGPLPGRSAAPPPVPEGATPSRSVAVQRLFDPPGGGDPGHAKPNPPMPAALQRDDMPDSAPPAAPAAVSAPGAPGPAAGPAAALPTDLDELARRLFDPLSARLRAELWLDRERAGLSMDLRR